MNGTTLTSIRLDNDTLEYIGKFLKKHSYWKRSEVINGILAAVTQNFTDWEVYQMLQRYNWSRNKVDAHFEITKELKTPNGK